MAGKLRDDKINKVLNLVKKGEMNKATYVFEKMAIGALGVATVGLIGLSLAPKPRKTATTITKLDGTNTTIKMKKLINLPRKK